jgi:hypothetical protein
MNFENVCVNIKFKNINFFPKLVLVSSRGLVMDNEAKMCVDPGGNGAILRAGEESYSWHQTVVENRCLQNVRKHGERVRHNTKAP